MSNQSFLLRLQQEAALQAKLHEHRFFPPQVDWLTSLIGRYPWQFTLGLSGLTTFILEITKYW